MSKKAKVYCDKCGSPRGLESIAQKEVKTCEICGKSKPCNVIKETKVVVEKKVETPVVKKKSTPKEEVKPVVKKETPKKKAASKTAKKAPVKKTTKKTSKKK